VRRPRKGADRQIAGPDNGISIRHQAKHFAIFIHQREAKLLSTIRECARLVPELLACQVSRGVPVQQEECF
jgi:hypothetical protein